MTSGPLGDLLALQDLDLSIDQLRHRRRTLPERAELEAIDGQMSEVRRDLTAAEAARAEVAARQSANEADLAATEQRSAAVSRRLYGGEVSASRELQAMSDELDQLKARSSALEDAVLETLEEREPLDGRVAELTAQMGQLAGRRTDVAGRLAAAEAVVDGELQELTTKRQAAAGPIPEGLLASYERLRTRLGGIAVSRLSGNRCDGCHLTLSAVELERVRHLAEGDIYTCEQCTRILVP